MDETERGFYGLHGCIHLKALTLAHILPFRTIRCSEFTVHLTQCTQ